MNRDDRRSISSVIPGQYDEIYMTIPLDGGYAWVIMSVAFFCFSCTDGSIFAFGKLTKVLATDFDLTDDQVALLLSIQTSVQFFIGPVASAIVNKFGFRAAAMTGAITSISGVLIASFVKNYVPLVIFYGFFAGAGFGMVYTTSNVIVGYYFERYRALAVGVSMSGSGVGTMVLAPVATAMVDNFGLSTLFRSQAGLFCVVLALVMFYRPIKPTKVLVEIRKRDTESYSSLPSRTISNAQTRRPSKTANLHQIYKIPSNPMIILDNMGSQASMAGSLQRTDAQRPGNVPRKPTMCQKFWNDACYYSFCCFFWRKQSVVEQAGSMSYAERPLYREDAFLTHRVSLTANTNPGARQFRSIHPIDRQPVSIDYHLTVMRAIEPEPDTIDRHCCPLPIKNAFGILFDTSLLRSFTFACIGLAGLISIQGLYIPYLYITDRALANNISAEHAGLMLSSMGLANTIGRMSCALISFFPIEPCLLSGVTQLASGIATFITAFRPHEIYQVQVLYSLIYGFGTAYLTAMRAVIVVDYLGLEKLTNAIGLNSVILGTAALVGPTIAGIIKMHTGSYFWPFIYSGICLCGAALSVYMVPTVCAWEQKRDLRKAMAAN